MSFDDRGRQTNLPVLAVRGRIYMNCPQIFQRAGKNECPCVGTQLISWVGVGNMASCHIPQTRRLQWDCHQNVAVASLDGGDVSLKSHLSMGALLFRHSAGFAGEISIIYICSLYILIICQAMLEWQSGAWVLIIAAILSASLNVVAQVALAFYSWWTSALYLVLSVQHNTMTVYLCAKFNAEMLYHWCDIVQDFTNMSLNCAEHSLMLSMQQYAIVGRSQMQSSRRQQVWC